MLQPLFLFPATLSFCVYTVCPRNTVPFFSKLLYKMGHYFLDIWYRSIMRGKEIVSFDPFYIVNNILYRLIHIHVDFCIFLQSIIYMRSTYRGRNKNRAETNYFFQVFSDEPLWMIDFWPIFCTIVQYKISSRVSTWA